MDITYNNFNNNIDILSEEINPKSTNNLKNIFLQYEKVIIENIVSSFLLDIKLINDRIGGNVDTVHNVRQGVEWKNQKNKNLYVHNEPYNSNEYHNNHPSYIKTRKHFENLQDEGLLHDSYSNQSFNKDMSFDLDHTIPASKIHNDKGRILAEMSGPDLANASSNLNPTTASINRSKGSDNVDVFVDKVNNKRKNIEDLQLNENLTKKQIDTLDRDQNIAQVDISQIKNKDHIARADYERKIFKKYYTSRKFANDTINSSLSMGKAVVQRKVLGIFFTELYIFLRYEIPPVVKSMKNNFSLKKLLKKVSLKIKDFLKIAKDVIFKSIPEFVVSFIYGAVSDITNTLINIFSTTSRLVAKILRDLWSAIVEVIKILFFNKDELRYGDQIKAASKVLFTSISVIMGTFVYHNLISIPFLNKLKGVPEFLSSLVTGLLSVSLLYYIENSETVDKLVKYFNNRFIDAKILHKNLIEVEKDLNEYAAYLGSIDLESFNSQLEEIKEIRILLNTDIDKRELNHKLTEIIKKRNIYLPYSNFKEFDQFMMDPNTKLIL